MSKILSYIGLHFRLTFRKDKKSDIKSDIITFIMGLLTCTVVLVLCRYFFSIINKKIINEVTVQRFSVLLVFLIEIILIVVGIFLEIKFFLKPNDVKITARFPITNLQLFISQLLIIYLYLFGIAFLLMSSIMIVFGSSVGIITGAFIIRLLLTTFLSPLIPFAFATLFVVPVMYILTLLENKNITKLILFLIFLASAFFLYSRLLNFLAEYYVHQNIGIAQKNLIVGFVNSLNNGWNFFSYVNNLIFGTQVLKSLAIILSATIVILAMGILISIPIYTKTRENILEGKESIFYKNSKATKESAFFAIFNNEFKNIIRTNTHAFFYLGISITTPVMVLLTNSLIQKVGTAQIGKTIIFGISLLIVLIFMSMINSFSASTISREGKEFYITKIIPVDYRVQLLAKGLLNAIISVGVLIISIIILCSMNFISVLQGFIIFIVSLSVSIGIILNGFNINARRPNINKLNEGEESQTNPTLVMFIGIFLSAIESLIAIILNFFIKIDYIYLMLIGISLIYVVINALIFNFTTNKKYSEIE